MKPRNHKYFPSDPFLCLVISGSGKGKTHFVYDLLTTEGYLDYNNLIIYTNKPNIKYYELLKHGFKKQFSKETLFSALRAFEIKEKNDEVEVKDIEELLDAIKESPSTDIKVTISKRINYNDIPKNDKTIVIFDDCINDGDQELQKEIFISGRGDQIGAFYITQCFSDLESMIKKNASCCVLFDVDDYDLQNINRRFNTGMDNKQFKSFCKKVWDDDQYKHIYINPLLPRKDRVITNLIKDPLAPILEE